MILEKSLKSDSKKQLTSVTRYHVSSILLITVLSSTWIYQSFFVSGTFFICCLYIVQGCKYWPCWSTDVWWCQQVVCCLTKCLFDLVFELWTVTAISVMIKRKIYVWCWNEILWMFLMWQSIKLNLWSHQLHQVNPRKEECWQNQQKKINKIKSIQVRKYHNINKEHTLEYGKVL